MNKTLLILAAGKGSRFGGLKQLTPVGPNDEKIIDYSIFDAINSGYNKIVFVIEEENNKTFHSEFDYIKRSDAKVFFAYQKDVDGQNPLRKKPWGTLHALLSAKPFIDGYFTIINSDDFYGREAFQIASDFIDENSELNSIPYNNLLVGYELGKTLSPNGSVARGICKLDESCNIISIEEHKRIVNIDGEIYSLTDDGNLLLNYHDVASMNIFTFHSGMIELFEASFNEFLKNNKYSTDRECYVPDELQKLINRNLAKVKVKMTKESWFGMTYKEDLPQVKKRIKQFIESGKYPINIREEIG